MKLPCSLTRSVPTEQRSVHFSRTNTTIFRGVLQISLMWFVFVDQPSHFSISWEYIPFCTSCEQWSSWSHHFAFGEKQTMAENRYGCSSSLGRPPSLTAPRWSCWLTSSHATHNYQVRVCFLCSGQNCYHLLLLLVSRIPLQ